ncbi:MAG: XRE family transcriptional regulator [Gammaproteobacteria bacterium RIFOXYA12_FULL_61_12]|nr:MAG: XRE family transcriptional regulator [Gammaproteobacteria bacterium RIFOXYD12_FULL_61_37]OGT94180.1 MAG: XRE family transcriptional regulator [Gammaproteobacteria bacterium RIFOXYA12_FULL_61_12]
MSAQIIEQSGKPEYAVVPWDEWQAIMERLEELQDIVDADAAKAAIRGGEETFPAELVDRLLSGENKVRVWREYRGLTAARLAELAGVTPAAISQIESGKRGLSVDLLKKLAEALRLDLDDLVG